MNALVLTMVTVGESWETLDASSKTNLTQWVEQTVTNADERALRLDAIKNGLWQSPLTAHVAALGVYDVVAQQGSVYYHNDDRHRDELVGTIWYRERSEAALLEQFWQGVTEYDTLVSFGGRRFLVPFLLHRSITNTVVPSVDLARHRYLNQQTPPYHIDLEDQLSLYGTLRPRPNLSMLCRAYGIENGFQTITKNVTLTELYTQKRFREIASYCQGILMATTALYEKWQTYLAPTQFKKLPEGIDF